MDRSPLPPSCAARFQWVRPLASGGFGAVHLCTQRGLDRQVVVKLLHGAALADSEQVGRFVNEARITASIEHPHVVRVIDHGADGDAPWIAYEYVPGRNLRQLLADGPLPPAVAVRAALHVLAALSAAHERGIVHRDVKPENVLETGDGAFKVTDFGIAKWTSDTAVHTKTGVVLGTPAYMAPELIRAEAVGPAADLYSAGAMLHELLAGEPPFHHDNPIFLLELHLQREPPPLPGPVRDHAPGLDRVVRRALEKDPAMRYASAEEMRADLARLKVADTPAGLPAMPPAPARPGATRAGWKETVAHVLRSSGQFARRTRWALSTFVLLAIAGLVWAIAHRPPAPAPPRDLTAEVDSMAGEMVRIVDTVRPRLVRQFVRKLRREGNEDQSSLSLRARLLTAQAAEVARLEELAARARRLGDEPLAAPQLEAVQIPYAYVLMNLAYYEKILAHATPPFALGALPAGEVGLPAAHWVASLVRMQRHAVDFDWDGGQAHARAARQSLARVKLDALTPAGERLLEEVVSIEGEKGFQRLRERLSVQASAPAEDRDGWAFLSFALAFAEHQARQRGSALSLGIEPLTELVEMLRPGGLYDAYAERAGERAHLLADSDRPGGARREVLVRRLNFWRATLPVVLTRGRGGRIRRRVESVQAGAALAVAADKIQMAVELPALTGASDAMRWAVGLVQALRHHMRGESFRAMDEALDARDAFERDLRQRDLSDDDEVEALRLRIALLKIVSAAHAKAQSLELNRRFPGHRGHERCCAFYREAVAMRRSLSSSNIHTADEIAKWNVAAGCSP